MYTCARKRMIQGESEREEKREKARERVGGKRERKGGG